MAYYIGNAEVIKRHLPNWYFPPAKPFEHDCTFFCDENNHCEIMYTPSGITEKEAVKTLGLFFAAIKSVWITRVAPATEDPQYKQTTDENGDLQHTA